MTVNSWKAQCPASFLISVLVVLLGVVYCFFLLRLFVWFVVLNGFLAHFARTSNTVNVLVVLLGLLSIVLSSGSCCLSSRDVFIVCLVQRLPEWQCSLLAQPNKHSKNNHCISNTCTPCQRQRILVCWSWPCLVPLPKNTRLLVVSLLSM